MSSWKRKKGRAKVSRLKMQIEQRRVVILTPAGDMCHTGFAYSLAHMIKHTFMNIPGNLECFGVECYGTSILPFSRQVLAKAALEQGYTHMLWIDSDMEFPQDMLLRFLLHDEPLIGINAMSRRKPFRNTAQSAPGEMLATTPESTGLEKVYRMGFGVVWVACEIFEKMDLPWFDFEWMPEESIFRGEDYVFFEKAKALGYECYVDHDISKGVFHMGSFGYNPMLMGEAQASGHIAA